jgi:single-strand DNA-binding protein
MNKVILMGRLTKEVDNKGSVQKFSIAVDRRFKKEGQPDADFFNIVAFGKTGEFAANYFTKGMRVVVVGRLQNGQYEVEGVKRYSTDVIAEEVYFADSKKAQDNGFSQVNGDDELPF